LLCRDSVIEAFPAPHKYNYNRRGRGDIRNWRAGVGVYCSAWRPSADKAGRLRESDLLVVCIILLILLQK